MADSVTSKKKFKILTISDHPLSPSGVGTQTKYICEALLKTGDFEIISFGGAMKHQDYRPIKTDQWGDDWLIHPVDGYGNQEMVRSVLRFNKPDMIWFMTDPRFFGWLWEIEDEIRSAVPMVYYHVWDNYPYPYYNEQYYSSTDVIACISKVTYDIVQNVAPDVESIYLPHAVDSDVFKKIPEEKIFDTRKQVAGDENKFIVFWNNRNARRKQSGSVIFWFKSFLNKVGQDKAVLVMHTDVKDQHGQDLEAIIRHLGLTNGEVKFSQSKIPPDKLSILYNMADVTINISDAEGFGLATLESLACETPIIVNMTGGLQEQVTDGEQWFGVGIEPSSRAIIGSQPIPWIYEDRISEKDFVEALTKLYEMSKEERDALGARGRHHVEKNYNYNNFCNKWVSLVRDICERHGSWENRKGYKSWEMLEV